MLAHAPFAVTAFVAVSADARNQVGLLDDRLDIMRTVAVGANGCIEIAGDNRLFMQTNLQVLCFAGVTGDAGIDRLQRIFARGIRRISVREIIAVAVHATQLAGRIGGAMHRVSDGVFRHIHIQLRAIGQRGRPPRLRMAERTVAVVARRHDRRCAQVINGLQVGGRFRRGDHSRFQRRFLSVYAQGEQRDRDQRQAEAGKHKDETSLGIHFRSSF